MGRALAQLRVTMVVDRCVDGDDRRSLLYVLSLVVLGVTESCTLSLCHIIHNQLVTWMDLIHPLDLESLQMLIKSTPIHSAQQQESLTLVHIMAQSILCCVLSRAWQRSPS